MCLFALYWQLIKKQGQQSHQEQSESLLQYPVKNHIYLVYLFCSSHMRKYKRKRTKLLVLVRPLKSNFKNLTKSKIEAKSTVGWSFHNFWSLKIRRSARFVLLRNVVRQILKLKSCERMGRETMIEEKKKDLIQN